MLGQSLLSDLLRVESVVPELLLHEGVGLHLVLRLLSHEIGLLGGREQNNRVNTSHAKHYSREEGGGRERKVSMFFLLILCNINVSEGLGLIRIVDKSSMRD